MRAEDLAGLPPLESELRDAVESSDWHRASTLVGRILEIDPARKSAVEAEPVVAEGLRVTQIEREAGIRVAQIDQGIADAKVLAGNANECAAFSDIIAAWNKLKIVRQGDPQWKAALAVTQDLERCRLRAKADVLEATAKEMSNQRAIWRDRYERALAEQGVNAEVTLLGPKRDTVRIKWALLSKTQVNKFTEGASRIKGSFLDTLERIGFSSVILTDGFTGEWTYVLFPDSEEDAAAAAFAEQGFGQPFSLTPPK